MAAQDPLVIITTTLAGFRPKVDGLSRKLNQTVDDLVLREDVVSEDNVTIGSAVTWIEKHFPYVLRYRIVLYLIFGFLFGAIFVSEPIRFVTVMDDPLQHFGSSPIPRRMVFPFIDTLHIVLGLLCLGCLGAAANQWRRRRMSGRFDDLSTYRSIVFGVDGSIRTPYGLYREGLALPVISDDRGAVRQLRYSLDDVQSFLVRSYEEQTGGRPPQGVGPSWCVVMVLSSGQEIVLSRIRERRRGDVQPILIALERAYGDAQARCRDVRMFS